MSDPGYLSIRSLLPPYEAPPDEGALDAAPSDGPTVGDELVALAGPQLKAIEAMIESTARHVRTTPAPQLFAEGGSLALRGFLMMVATIPSDVPADERARWAAPREAPDAGTAPGPQPTPAPAPHVLPARLEDRPRDPWLRPISELDTYLIDPRKIAPTDPNRAVASAKGKPGDPAPDSPREPDATATSKPRPERKEAKIASLLDSLRSSASDDAGGGLPGLADRLLLAMHVSDMRQGDALPYARELAAAAGQRRERMNEALLVLREEGSVEATQVGRSLVLTADPAPRRPASARPASLPLRGGDAAIDHFPSAETRSNAYQRGTIQDAACLALLKGLAASQASAGFTLPALPLLSARTGYGASTLAQAYPRLQAHGVTIAVRDVEIDRASHKRSVVTEMPPPAQLQAAIAQLQAKLGTASRVDGATAKTATPLRLDRPSAAQLNAFERITDRPTAGTQAPGELFDLVALHLLKGFARGGYQAPAVVPTAKELGTQLGVGPRTVIQSLDHLPRGDVRVETAYVQLPDRLSYRMVLTSLPPAERLEELIRSLEAKTRSMTPEPPTPGHE